MTLFMDRALARSLERTEGAINAAFVEARARSSPALGATHREVDGTLLMFDGPDSPMTQSFGLGLSEQVSAGSLAGMEAFFESRGAPVHHEVSPLAGIQTFRLLAERGYRPIELTTVLVQPLDASLEPPALEGGLSVRAARPEDAERWIETSVAGWGERAEVTDPIRDIATVALASLATVNFLVEREGLAIATGSLGIQGNIALLAGASTVPDHRGLGAQRALLRVRLAEAKRRGCEIAVMGAEPGSTSQRNAERNGFRVAYTRVKWQKDAAKDTV